MSNIIRYDNLGLRLNLSRVESLRLRAEGLETRLNMGIFVNDEWVRVIDDLFKAGMNNRACLLENKRKHYLKIWEA